jgi:hypothetical protein
VIPVASREYVEYTDTDGIVFRFVPKSGELEMESFDLFRKSETEEAAGELYKRINAFVDKILLAPKYHKAASLVLNTQEKYTILDFWHKANRISTEEKKS